MRARSFDLHGAIEQFKSTEKWRSDEKVNDVYAQFNVEEFKEAQSVYPQWTGRRDKAGLAVYIFKVGALTKEMTNKYAEAEDRINERTIALYELMNQFVIPFTNSLPRPHQEAPICATSTIVDISGVSLSRFWNLRNHMSRVSVLASAHYPETLGSIYIIGAPSFFSVVFGWITKWFDSGTTEKIKILKDTDALQVLSAHIPLSSIPQVYGGELPFIYGETKPILDEESKALLGLDDVPRGSISWNDDEGGGFSLLGTGRTQEEIEQCTPKVKDAEKKVVNSATTNGNSLDSKPEEEATVLTSEKEESITPITTTLEGITI